MKVLETDRTILREVTPDDAGFVLELLNQSSFIRYIGDRNVRNVDQARDYIEQRFVEGYRKFGFGMWAVVLKETGELIGICGLVRRESLPEADIGFALLPPFEGKGYAFETAAAVLRYGETALNFGKVLAITSIDNEASGKLLGKLGFEFERLLTLPGSDQEIKLFSRIIAQNSSSAVQD